MADHSPWAASRRDGRVLPPPTPLVIVLFAASGLAVTTAGALATVHLLWQVTVPWDEIPPGHWLAIGGTLVLTLASLTLRGLRWIFLLRRTGTYAPLRDAVVVYLSGFSLMFLPLLASETLLRGLVARQRRAAPAETVMLVTYWGRLLDGLALVMVAGGAAALGGSSGPWPVAAIAIVVAIAVPATRVAVATAARRLAGLLARIVFGEVPSTKETAARRLASPAAFGIAFGLSLAAWALPGLGLWWLVQAWSGALSPFGAQGLFSSAALTGGAVLAPGGVLVVGASLLGRLTEAGLTASAATLVVFGLRVGTIGLAVTLGLAFVGYHYLRRPAPSGAAHFDNIADVYDAQIPEGRRRALLDRKTTLMRRALPPDRPVTGLDVGCGQGHYVARMRELGYEVLGIDDSSHQVERAGRLFERPDVVRRGSILAIPYEDNRFDFVYCINVLHHLDSIEVQRLAFGELARVLKPGGTLFVHEINTRNWLFRFYMGYVFPALNCIDEGTERWLLPHRLAAYTDLPVQDVAYFTFLPEFVPATVVRWLAPIERRLETSSLRCYSAHYMAVLRKRH